jgi:site-specific DNA-methyltransferase (adenine-specific)
MKAPRLIHADCLDALRAMDACSVDAIVTDPPAGIAFMNKDWDRDKGGRAEWVAWMTEIARECLRVVKPGGHALVWAIPRTSHWTGWAWEDAGWQPRDKVVHLFGSGFPKSLDVSKAIDKAAGAEREVISEWRTGRSGTLGGKAALGGLSGEDVRRISNPATEAARQWQGWGSALKPAAEDWWLMRKPLDGTIAANVLKHGTGAINVDGCRVGTTKRVPGSPRTAPRNPDASGAYGFTKDADGLGSGHDANVGRWPANVVLGCACDGDTHDENCAAAMLDAQTGTLTSGSRVAGNYVLMGFGGHGSVAMPALNSNSGGPSRFFYVAKPSRAERDAGCAELEPQQRDEGRVAGAPGGDNPRNRGASERTNSHPTVKSIALMRWLVRLITPPGGVVLDPFCGSGTTLLACIEEGVDAIGIEREAEYVEIIRRRVAYALKTPPKTTKRKPRPVAPVTPQPAPVAPTMNDMASRQLGLFDGV